MGVAAERLRGLAEPFGPDELEWRVGRTGEGAKGPSCTGAPITRGDETAARVA